MPPRPRFDRRAPVRELPNINERIKYPQLRVVDSDGKQLGVIDETKHLISQYGSDLPILQTIGYREARDVLNNKLSIANAIELTTIKTIQFAKRQRTWFRNKNNPIWLNNKNLLKDAIIKIESFLG